MKMKIILIAMLALPLLMGAGCKKKSLLPDTFDTISPDTETQVINKNIDGINFQFFLLNKDNKPSTVFNEGENFDFYFSAMNLSDKKIYFDPDFAHTNDNSFCEVFNNEGISFGKPFVFKGVALIGEGAYSFKKGENKFV